jgi:VWFA-related protein
MNKKRRVRGVLLGGLAAMGLLLAQAGGPLASGQAQPQQAVTKPLQHEVSVALKLIHVYVTDKKGHPVKDLAIGDFTVTDDGQPVTVTDFEKHVLEAAAAPEAADVPSAAVEEKVPPQAPAVPPTSRKFFLFFDFAFNNARGIVKAKTAALHFLDSEIRPEDEVGVLSYSMLKGISIYEYLTRDHDKVREVLDKIGAKGIDGRASEMETLYWQLVQEPLPVEQRGGDSADKGAPGLAVSSYAYAAKTQREEAKKIAENYMLRLADLARSLRYVQGQKHFMMFSSGLPTSLVYGTQSGNPGQTSTAGSWGPGQLDLGDSVLKSRNEAMTKEFAAAGCTFFAFDTRESAKGIDLFGYDSRTMETGARGGVFGKDGVFSESSNVVQDEKGTGLDYLKMLTDRTGGKYYSNINRYEKNFDQVQNLTGTFYVLGYPVDEKWDGRFHAVKVEVKRKGCEVRAQAGYFNPKPYSEYTGLEKQLHLFDLALNERALSRMAAKVPMTALAMGAEGLSRLGLLARVPAAVNSRFAGKRTEFVAIFFDEKGEIKDMVREEAPSSSMRGGELAFAAGAALPPGDYSCRLVIRDMDTGQSAVASAKATVVKPQITGLQLGTPLVLEARTGCSFLSAGSKKAKEAFPWADIYPYDSTNLSPVIGELPAAAPSVMVVLPCAVAGGGQTELAFSANRIDAVSGARSPLTILRLDRARKGSLDILTMEIRTEGVTPGTHYLHIYAQDRTSGSLGHTFTTLTVPKR